MKKAAAFSLLLLALLATGGCEAALSIAQTNSLDTSAIGSFLAMHAEPRLGLYNDVVAIGVDAAAVFPSQQGTPSGPAHITPYPSMTAGLGVALAASQPRFLVLANATGHVHVCAPTAGGDGWQPCRLAFISPDPVSFVLSLDSNNDGHMDVALVQQVSGLADTVAVLIGDGTGELASGHTFTVGTSGDVTAADMVMGGSGAWALFAASSNSRVVYMRQSAAGSSVWSVVSDEDTSSECASPLSFLTAGNFFQTGNLDDLVGGCPNGGLLVWKGGGVLSRKATEDPGIVFHDGAVTLPMVEAKHGVAVVSNTSPYSANVVRQNNNALKVVANTIAGQAPWSLVASVDVYRRTQSPGFVAISPGPSSAIAFVYLDIGASYCPTLAPPTNGVLSATTGFVDDVAIASCNAGYAFAGPTQTAFRCLPGPAWNGTVPASCAALACPPLTAPTDGTLSATTGVYQDTVTIGCNNGFQLSGPASTTCTVAQTWSPDPAGASCSPVDCGALASQQTLVDGVISCTGQVFTDVCTLSCNTGFSIVGDTSRTCLASGSWSGTADAFCSAFNISQTLVTTSLPAAGVVGDVAPWSVSVTVRNSQGVAITTGADTVLVTGGNLAAPHVLSYVGSGEFADSGIATGNLAGTFVFNLTVNGLTVPASVLPNLLRLTLFPGAAVAASTVASGPGLEGGADGQPWSVTVTPLDVFGNPVSSFDPALVVASLRRGSTEIPVSVGVFDPASGTVPLSATLGSGGLYTLSIELVGQGGIVSSPWAIAVSSSCTPGSYAVEATGPCELCPLDTYSDAPDVLACTGCPLNTHTNATGTTSAAGCLCNSGFHAPDVATPSACEPCPAGASCAGDLTPPYARPGFYEASSGEFVACQRPESCQGNGACARGYTGFLCASCASGYYGLSGQCYACQPNQFFAMLVLFVFVCLVVSGALIWANSRDRAFYGMTAFLITLNSLQVIGIYGQIALNWPTLVQNVFDAISLVNLNLELTSPECSLSITDPFVTRWVLTLLMPLFFIAMFGVCYALGMLYTGTVRRCGPGFERSCSSFCERPSGMSIPMATRLRYRASTCCTSAVATPRSLAAAAARAYVQALLCLYLPIVANVFRVMDCQRINNTLVLRSNPSRSCGGGTYWALFAVSCVFALLYGVGIPVALGLLLRSRAKALASVVFYARYAFLVARFSPSNLYHEVLLLVRKFAVVVCASLFRAPLAKAGTMLLVLCGALMHHAHRSPYVFPTHNLIETLASMASLVVLVGGMMDGADILRQIFTTAGLFACLLILVMGMAWELWRMTKIEKDALEETGDTLFANTATTGSFGSAEQAGLVGDVQLDHIGSGGSGEMVLSGGPPPDPRMTIDMGVFVE